jgi:hypothetical protein
MGGAVLLKIYSHCIDGQPNAANRRITDVLGTKDSEPEPTLSKMAAASKHPEKWQVKAWESRAGA